MKRRNGPRRQPAAPQLPPELRQLPPEEDRRLRHAMFCFMRAVLVDHETPECTAEVAQGLAAMILGQHMYALCSARGITFDRALAEGLQWVTDEAALSASPAAAGEGSSRDG